MSTNLFTSANIELFEWPDVINKNIHKSQLIRKAHEYVKTRRMQRDTVSLFSKLLINLQSP